MKIWRPKGPFPLFINDFKDDTLGWPEVQQWRYLQVLAYGWSQGGLIPDSDELMTQLVGAKRRLSWDLVRSYLIKHPTEKGYLTQKRLLRDLKKAQERSNSGKKGGKSGRVPPVRLASSM